MTLRFSDGVSIDTQGPYRAIQLADGWYVIGHGMMSPENDRTSAQAYAKELRERLLEEERAKL